jgi:hypothetical protein
LRGGLKVESGQVAEQHPRRFCQVHSRLGVETGIARGLVPVDVHPTGHMGQQLGQLHGVPGATTAAPARRHERTVFECTYRVTQERTAGNIDVRRVAGFGFVIGLRFHRLGKRCGSQ